MSISAESAPIRHIAPPLVPAELNGVLRDADALLTLMGRETLAVVAELAGTLTASAHDARAWEIEAAATAIRRIASGTGPAVLTGAMRDLTNAIARVERAQAA
jgi:hypothetical protein